MHRSGTSALTGALGHLGLQLPDQRDLMAGMEDNPVHYESRALSEVDDSLLAALGGSWSAPPELEAGWQRSPTALSHLERARNAAWRAFPLNRPIAFKDPRLCLLLPFWRSQLQSGAHALLVWRSPLAVARSLRARQNFTISLGLALWEVYARGALKGLEGLQVTVLPFERVLEDPPGVVGRVADWLVRTGCLDRPPTDEELGAAVSSINLQQVRRLGDGAVPDEHEEIVKILRSLEGEHEHLPEVELPSTAMWATDAVLQRLEFEALYRKYVRYAKLRRRIPVPESLLRRLKR